MSSGWMTSDTQNNSITDLSRGEDLEDH